jgi:hypothetical protein
MEVRLGPFDPALHVRSRDHYEALRREVRLQELGNSSAASGLDELLGEMSRSVGAAVPVNDVVDRAYVEGASTFTATITVPDDRVPFLLEAFDQVERLLDELDHYPGEGGGELLPAPEDVRRYRREYFAQVRAQLRAVQAAAEPSAGPGPAAGTS